MKIKTTITEIEATAEDLRQSNALGESVSNLIRRMFNGAVADEEEDDEDDE